jgi:hypothetical protein
MIPVYVVRKNADEIEGRGPMELHSIWTERAEAVKFIESQAGFYGRKEQWYGDSFGLYSLQPMYALEQIEELKEVEQQRQRDRALAKLTLEERRLLGLA